MSVGPVSLYLIDGERITPRSLRLAVAELDRRFVEDDKRHLSPYGFDKSSAWPEGDEVWLWLDDADGREIGFCNFWSEGGMSLQRVWIEPSFRRMGLLTDAWDEWVDRYGPFAVAEPNAAMRAFLDRQERRRKR